MSNEPRQGGADPPTAGPDRFGPYAVTRQRPGPDENRALPLFAPAPDGGWPAGWERRRSIRFAPLEQRLWVGWWAGGDRFRTVPALLENISQGGARVRLAEPPGKDQVVWLCLGQPDPAECASAKVLQVIPLAEGDFALRLAFGAPCPDRFYRIAVLGRDR